MTPAYQFASYRELLVTGNYWFLLSLNYLVPNLWSMSLLLQKLCLKGPGFKTFGNLAGSRGRSENSSNLERGLHPSFPDPANSYRVSNCCKPLCKSPQEQLPVGGITKKKKMQWNWSTIKHLWVSSIDYF